MSKIEENDLAHNYSFGKTEQDAWDEYFRTFDLSSIPSELKRRAYKVYSDKFNRLSMLECAWDDNYDFDNEILNEGEVINVSPNNIKSVEDITTELMNKTDMLDFQFDVYRNNSIVNVRVSKIPRFLQYAHSALVPIIKDNVEFIKDYYDKNGYYCIREQEYVDKDTKEQWYMMLFNPKYQNSINKQMFDAGIEDIYHCAPSIYHNSIVKNGFKPSKGNDVMNYYDERTFFSTISKRNNGNFLEMLRKRIPIIKKQNKNFDGTFNYYKLSLETILDVVTFYYDPNGTKGDIYTKDVVPYSAVTNIYYLNLN